MYYYCTDTGQEPQCACFIIGGDLERESLTQATTSFHQGVCPHVYMYHSHIPERREQSFTQPNNL